MNIEAKNLSKIYGDGENRVVALDRANLEIVSSDFISIMGPSGSGKSTLLHLLSGLDKPSSGSLTYDGKDIYSYSDKELSAFRRKRIGFIFQQFNLLPVLTAKENIIMGNFNSVNESAENSRVKLLQIRVLLHGSNKLLDIGFLLLLLLQVLAQDFCH